MQNKPQINVTKVDEFHGHQQAVYALSASWKPGFLLSAGAEGVVAEWNIEQAEGKMLLQAPCPVYALHLDVERGFLAMGLRNGEIAFADIRNLKMIRRVKAHEGSVFDIQPVGDGSKLLACGEDGRISIWKVADFSCEGLIPISTKSIRTLSIHQPSGKVAIGSSDHQITVLNASLKPVNVWKAHENSVFRVLWSQNGETLFSGGRDAHIQSWNHSQPSEPQAKVPAHMYTINDLVFVEGGSILASGSMDKSIKLWNPLDLSLLKVISFEKNGCHFNGVNRLLWHEGSLFSCSDDRKIMRWDIHLQPS